MGAYTNRISWEALRSIDSATFTGSFQALGTPLENPSYICKLVNNSDRLVTLSIDGSTAIDVAPISSFWLYDEGKGDSPNDLALPQGTQFYVSGLSGGTGLVYLVTQHIVKR